MMLGSPIGPRSCHFFRPLLVPLGHPLPPSAHAKPSAANPKCPGRCSASYTFERCGEAVLFSRFSLNRFAGAGNLRDRFSRAMRAVVGCWTFCIMGVAALGLCLFGKPT